MSAPPQIFKGGDVRYRYVENYTFTAGENIGYDSAYTATTWPANPNFYSGIPVYLSAANTVKIMTAAYWASYIGYTTEAAKLNQPIGVQRSGVRLAPVGLIAVTYGDRVQCTSAIQNVAATADATNLYAGDLIPVFSEETVAIPLTGYVADADITLPGSKEILQLLDFAIFMGSADRSYSDGSTNSIPAASTVWDTGTNIDNSGFAQSANPGAGDMSVYGTGVGYATVLKYGTAVPWDCIIWIRGYFKGSEGAPHRVGRALSSGVARTSSTVTGYVYVEMGA